MLCLFVVSIVAAVLPSTLQISKEMSEHVNKRCHALLDLLSRAENEVASSDDFKELQDSDLFNEHVYSELGGYYTEFNNLCGSSNIKNVDEIEEVIKRVNSAFFFHSEASSPIEMSTSSAAGDNPRLRHSPSRGPSYISGHIHQQNEFDSDDEGSTSRFE